jgi:gamma-glutamyltranspeptidase/glutathione hydrolase
LLTLHDELGERSLESLFDHAIGLAEDGFEVSAALSRAFASQVVTYRENPAVSEFYPGGRAAGLGETVRRPNLAATLRRIVSDGRDGFYLGEPGEDIITALGGVITRDDLSGAHSEWVDPIGTPVAGLVAWSVPPNSQGYLGPGSLAVFERLGAPADESDPLWWHLLIESYRSLAWQRDDLVADPAHLPVPADQLLSTTRLDEAAASIDRDRARTWPRPSGSVTGTAYLCVCDGKGMGVSIIQSNYRGTGSPFGAARSGFLLQDRGTGFNLIPGHPNELAPGKRPLHTLAPTLWTDGDRTAWLLGTRGGAVQPQLIAQLGARAILGGLDLDEAQTLPRWTIPHFGPGIESQVQVEPAVDQLVVDDLRSRGHGVIRLDETQPGWGPMSIIDMTGSVPRPAADPRVDTALAMLA